MRRERSGHPTPSEPLPATSAPAKHPAGLRTLFVTEMWERFSYYGMRALLVLFMTDAVRGGMGLSDKLATSIYGLYVATVYLVALPGGWLGDRVWGARKSVWYGGIVIALGHFTLAIPRTEAFFLGLIFVAIGSGVLKSNISAMVGQLYPEGGARRDAGFTIFYMGVNIGAAIGPLVCGFLAESFDWHYGFAAAGVGMILGLVQFKWTGRNLGTVGQLPESEPALSKLEKVLLFSGVAGVVLMIVLGFSGLVHLDPVALAKGSTNVIMGIAVLFFASLFLFGKLTALEKRRVGVILVLFVSSAIFWAGFEQMGSSFNLFADRYTERFVGMVNRTIPASWFQSVGPVMIIVFAPVFASVWVALARRNLNPSLPVKFGLGLVFLATGFLVMAAAAKVVAGGTKVGPTWLITTYLLHTFGELCLSPVGLSSVTKLAPPRLVGQLMGSWFLATSLGGLLAGLIAGQVTGDSVEKMSSNFLSIVWMPLGAGILLILLARPIKKWTGGVT